jgi:acyl carrier protein phosphodiesterase
LNYIAHIHIGAFSQTSLLGNFLGDFIKGSQLDYLPPHIQQGVRLHRSVDTFTDTHPIVVGLKQQFPRNLRRMAGVVIDISFDHLLMRDWFAYNEQPFEPLFEKFYTELARFSLVDNKHYQTQAQRLLTHKWLHQYTQLDTCYQAFLSIERRLGGKILFADHAQHFLQHNLALFAANFKEFYPEVLDHGSQLVNADPQYKRP